MEPLPPAPPSPALERSPRRSHAGLAIAIIVAVLLLGAGGVLAYLAMNSYIVLPYLTPKPTLQEVEGKFDAITSATVTADVSLAARPRQSSTQPLPAFPKKEVHGTTGLFSAPSPSSLLSSLPGDLAISAHFTTDWTSGKESDQQTSMRGSFSTSGFSIAIDLDSRTVAGDTFIKVNKLPIPFIDVTPIAGSWIRTPKTLDSTSLLTITADDSRNVFTTSTEKPKPAAKKAALGDESKALVEEMIKIGAVSVISVETDTADDRPSWKMTLAYDDAKFRQAFKNVYAARSQRFPGAETYSIFSDDAAKAIDDPSAQAIAAALAKNQKAVLQVERRSHDPISLAVSLAVAPDPADAPKLKDKEFNIGLMATLRNVNMPVKVEAPVDALSYTQAANRVFGKTDEEANFDAQTQTVNDLREALNEYNAQHHTYPEKLSDLVGLVSKPFGDLKESTKPLGLDTDFTKRVTNIPNDIITNTPYPYTAAAAGYELKYEIRLPKNGREFSLEDYVEGTNTATEASISKEADAGKPPRVDYTKDTDGDGLKDFLEMSLYHTDPNKADTDGDGYSDGAEVQSRYDPLTNAKTGAKVKVPTS